MSMTVAVTRNLPGRFNGFLASCMLEIGPGVYVAPFLSKGVRDRIWDVMLAWSELIPDEGGIALVWREQDAPSGLGMRVLGWPKKEFLELDGLWLTAGNLTSAHDIKELEKLAKTCYDSEKDDSGDIAYS